MEPILPFWFKQRQGKAEAAGENIYRLSAPNQGEAFIGIRSAEKGRWSATLRTTLDGQEIAATGPEYATPGDAWDAAFELYRQHVIV